jgi:hypothetical protein
MIPPSHVDWCAAPEMASRPPSLSTPETSSLVRIDEGPRAGSLAGAWQEVRDGTPLTSSSHHAWLNSVWSMRSSEVPLGKRPSRPRLVVAVRNHVWSRTRVCLLQLCVTQRSSGTSEAVRLQPGTASIEHPLSTYGYQGYLESPPPESEEASLWNLRTAGRSTSSHKSSSSQGSWVPCHTGTAYAQLRLAIPRSDWLLHTFFPTWVRVFGVHVVMMIKAEHEMTASWAHQSRIRMPSQFDQLTDFDNS